jgi:hypothetical protein
MAAIEMNLIDGSVGTLACLFDRVTQRCDCQYPTAGCHRLSILPFRPRVKNLHVR